MVEWRLEQFDEIDSTSSYCAAQAKAGAAEGLAVLALRQSAGRGSRGRGWESPAGNLFLSVLLRPRLPVAALGAFALLGGLAVADAVRNALPDGPAPMLKWPNDVLLGGAKLAGLLIDTTPEAGRIDWLVVGMGVNLANKPEMADRRTACLADYGVAMAPQAAARLVLAALSARLVQFADQGGAMIREDWLDAAHPIGTELHVRGAGRDVTGRFAGLSDAGELLLRIENRIETFQTGEILLGAGGRA